MKLDANNEIRYLDTIEGSSIARYVVILDNEPTMWVLCDASDSEKVIRIVRVGGHQTQDTNGRFAMVSEILEDPDGAPLGVAPERVNEKSVYAYVIPRMHVLLGRLLRAAN